MCVASWWSDTQNPFIDGVIPKILSLIEWYPKPFPWWSDTQNPFLHGVIPKTLSLMKWYPKPFPWWSDAKKNFKYGVMPKTISLIEWCPKPFPWWSDAQNPFLDGVTPKTLSLMEGKCPLSRYIKLLSFNDDNFLRSRNEQDGIKNIKKIIKLLCDFGITRNCKLLKTQFKWCIIYGDLYYSSHQKYISP